MSRVVINLTSNFDFLKLFYRRSGTKFDLCLSLAELREPVDTFFDDVMVMADDVALKNNRLTLLNRLRSLFLRVADLSVL